MIKGGFGMENNTEKKQKFFTVKRIIILIIVVLLGTVTGRMALRGLMNLMLGGTMFGGNFL